ncbi:hypothetical protein PsorP6_002778 [Peronosclerospora sorghi]|uniref:Uncharacterized protein n=1 Tax=Peronosclerospora sorghi TaxID=230839 RepID=A0ACC0VL09_9STRA|nr:hypothetical protein PsorP6_002778 [Peronosclerospora sorghi]
MGEGKRRSIPHAAELLQHAKSKCAEWKLRADTLAALLRAAEPAAERSLLDKQADTKQSADREIHLSPSTSPPFYPSEVEMNYDTASDGNESTMALSRSASLPRHANGKDLRRDNAHKDAATLGTEPSDLLQPPISLQNQTFACRKEIETAFNNFAATQGYGIVCNTSNKQRNGKYLVYYQCDREGRPRNRLGLTAKTRRRVSRSKRNDCPFRVIGKEYETYWNFEVRNTEHNHDPSTHPSAHPVHLRLRPDISKTVVDLYESGVRPRNIQSHVRKVCDGVYIPAKAIYNRCQQATQAKLDVRTSMDVLL